MPKMKTNAAAKKRFTFTGTGKIKRKHAYHSHILTKKTTKQKRNLCYSGTVSAADEAQRMRENRIAGSPPKTLQYATFSKRCRVTRTSKESFETCQR